MELELGGFGAPELKITITKERKKSKQNRFWVESTYKINHIELKESNLKLKSNETK